MNSLRTQIEQMEPERYARAAKRAAEVAMKLAQKTGNEVPESTRYLYEASLEELAENQRRAQEKRSELSAE